MGRSGRKRQSHQPHGMKLYFAYGANLDRVSMRHRCPDAVPVQAAVLKDWQLTFNGVASIRPKPGAWVPGALWLISDRCEQSLDLFEGYPYLYDKRQVTVDGQTVMVYKMNRDDPQPPGTGYLNVIRRGYRDWRLDTGLLTQAVERAQDEWDILEFGL